MGYSMFRMWDSATSQFEVDLSEPGDLLLTMDRAHSDRAGPRKRRHQIYTPASVAPIMVLSMIRQGTPASQRSISS